MILYSLFTCETPFFVLYLTVHKKMTLKNIAPDTQAKQCQPHLGWRKQSSFLCIT